MCLFYVPFAVLFRLLVDVRWTRRAAAAVLPARGRPRAGVRRRRLLRVRHRPPAAVQREGPGGQRPAGLLPRQLAVLRPEHLRALPRADDDPARRHAAVEPAARRRVVLVAGALVVLWAGLVLSLSQSSFAALLGGLAVLAALRWRAWPVLGGRRGGRGRRPSRSCCWRPARWSSRRARRSALDRATSGRADLVRGAVDMARDRPLWGFGAGSFAERYRVREDVRSSQVAAISHTIPLTVAAEQGVIGLAAYLALMFTDAGAAVRRRARPAAARAARHRRRGAGRRGGGVLRARAAHAGLRGVPRGPADVDAAGHRRRTAPAARRLVAAGRGGEAARREDAAAAV